MANKKSQKQFVLEILRKEGYITRNYCLQNYISRLSDIIFKLKTNGINIEGQDMENGDYKYTLIDKPKEQIVYRVNGEIVAHKTIW